MAEFKITDNEKALIIAMRTKFDYGTVEVVVKGGEPKYIKRAWESAQLDSINLTLE